LPQSSHTRSRDALQGGTRLAGRSQHDAGKAIGGSLLVSAPRKVVQRRRHAFDPGGRHIEAAVVLTTAPPISIVPASMRTALPAGGNFCATRAQPAASTVALSGPLPMLASPMQRKSPSASRCKLRANMAANTADAWRSTKRAA
jgi:hypothetical protein